MEYLLSDYDSCLHHIEAQRKHKKRLSKTFPAIYHMIGFVLIEKRDTTVVMHDIARPAAITQYDVILSSYMRAGSTLLGLVLGFRDDTFYMYEPLWKTSRWTYWRGNNTVCRVDKPECREVKSEMDIPVDFADNRDNSSSGSLVMAKKVLWKVYDCLFNDFERTVMGFPLTLKMGGPSWQKVLVCCKNNNKLLKLCLHKYAPMQCKKSRHKVSKVLRLTTDNFENILQERQSLKVVHLFRDPRAIINSRIETGWYPANSINEIIDNAKALCSKMLYDFHAGNKLKEKYRDRFRYIFYEDFSSDPKEKLRALYRYLGMNLNSDRYKRVLQASIFRQKGNQSDRKKNTASWWRTSLDWETVKQLQDICGDVMDALGFVKYDTESELRNFSQNSFNFKNDDMLMTNTSHALIF